MGRTGASLKSVQDILLEEDRAIYEARSGKIPRSPRAQFRLIDLFCGAGGMTLGFSGQFGHPFKTVWANDINRHAVATYNANFGNHCTTGDLCGILKEPGVIPPADVVIGGPPCQGFSLLNKKKDNDLRNQLWRPYLEVVERSGARVFVIENVPQILGTFEHGEIVGAAEALGFTVCYGKVCAADYGVPQTRWRAFIIGSKDLDPGLIFPPLKTHYNPDGNERQSVYDTAETSEFLPGKRRWRTVRDAVADLPEPRGTEIRDDPPPLDLHFGRTPTPKSMKRYRSIPEEGMNRFDLQKRAPELTPACWIRKKSGGTDLFGRLWWDRPAVTIRTEFFKPEKGRYLHPEQHRPITHREAARFQSFPDSFIFRGSKAEIARQIGNAVPPLLAARLADIVQALLSGPAGK
jgi:DNA (cytosine-5)-methyltransferase 1